MASKEPSKQCKNPTQIRKVLFSLAKARDLQSLVAKLLKHGISIDMLYPDGKTLLMLAVEKGDLKAVGTLIEARCDMDVQNSNGETAAMFAVRANKRECLKLLRESGANLEITNENAETVRDLAFKGGKQKMADEIIMAGNSGCSCRAEEMLPTSDELDIDLDIDFSWECQTLDECQQLELTTRINGDQLKKELKTRITSDKFGHVHYVPEQVDGKALREIFIEPKPTEPWGRYRTDNIGIARLEYMRATKNHVHDIGLVVHPKLPFIAARPSGRVCSLPENELGIIHIKCVYGIRDMLIADAARKETFCLRKGKSKYTLKNRHKFYFEVQGQLLITGAPFCDFVIYTRRDLAVVRIFPDETTQADLVEELSEFYFKHAQKYLLGLK